MSASHPPSSDPARYALLEQVQRNVLEAHRHFQETLAQSHLAFLQTSEALLRQIAGGGEVSLHGQNGHNGHAPALPALPALPPRPVALPPVAPVAVTAPAPRTMPRPQAVAPKVVEPVRAPVRPAPAAAPVAAAPAPSLAPRAAANGSAPDLQGSILATVAQSTGYPVEMIELDMDLESGLGIDSIKKVEIFAALQGKIPELAGADATQVGNLTTIRAILDFTRGLTGAAGQIKN